MEEDYYMILGVDPKATELEIRQAYKRMVLIYHPDKNKHPRTTAQFRKIKEAFDVLSDPTSRRAYDGAVERSRPADTRNNSHNSGGYQPNGFSQSETESMGIMPTVCAVGGLLVGLFIGIGAYRTMSGSNNNH
ncbi:chaperone protein DnaJ [Drosophila sechellia]|uniref:GM11609 n=1 Tax=Drosophila sechellia TaxID=7238 RepID=B4IGN9_DROSE|nr:chaperone protein DnaJ [Drosophila sechellia]EDW48989.1 GM11609 [Drosophila sechellia]